MLIGVGAYALFPDMCVTSIPSSRTAIIILKRFALNVEAHSTYVFCYRVSMKSHVRQACCFKDAWRPQNIEMCL